VMIMDVTGDGMLGVERDDPAQNYGRNRASASAPTARARP
jgi:hypothetical protein